MKINSINNPNFRALSLRAATVGLSDCRNDESEKEKMENIIVEQAKNNRYHIDFQNYGFVVCEARTTYSRLNEYTSKRIVEFKPVTERLYSIESAAKIADQLEEAKKPYRQEKILSDKIFNYTI